MSWREEYFDRVRPVVGEALASRRLWLWDLSWGYLAAEALARTGLRRQVWYDSGLPGGALARSLGQQTRTQAGRADALAGAIRDHNRFESDWQLESRPPSPLQLARDLTREPPHLLLAAVDQHAGQLARLVVDHGIPAVLTRVEAVTGVALHAVWAPPQAKGGADELRQRFIEACELLASLPALDLDRPEHHVDGLEARSTALSLARWLLVRDPRPDLMQPLVEQGRSLLLRGRPDWPWHSGFIAPRRLGDVLQRLRRVGNRHYAPPLALLRPAQQRLLVIGLGTASLLCAEAPLLAHHLVLADAKPVSPFNPVRQVYGTEHVGRPKPEALAEILSQRVDPSGPWERTRRGDLQLLQRADRSIGYTELHLTGADDAAEQRFEALLDQVRPTLAVVGMGRSRDDNFIATAALRRRGIVHITPTAFPGVTHFKHILTDGPRGPCYDCLQGHLMLDAGPGPKLSQAQRELFYGGTQPATLAETYPSTHSLLRLTRDLALPRGARPTYLLAELAAERCCFVGANRAEQDRQGQWLYGADRPFSMVTYGIADLAPGTGAERPCSCGRRNVR